jgi:hypothetical protein
MRKVPTEAFSRDFQQWQDPWSKCARAQGSYCEGDWVSAAACPTTVQYQNAGNFLTARRTCVRVLMDFKAIQ